MPKDTEGFEQFAQQNSTVTPLLSAVVRVNRQMEEMAKLGKANHATLDLLVNRGASLSHTENYKITLETKIRASVNAMPAFIRSHIVGY